MKKLITLLHSNILTAVVFLGLACSSGFSQNSSSPVGTWEIAIARTKSPVRETGTAFLTFSNDNTFTGYGMTTESFSVFKLSGTWSVDASGKITGDITKDIFGDLLTGTFVGKAKNGKKLELNAAELDGDFSMKGDPANGTPDFSGAWGGTILHSIGTPPIESGDPSPRMKTTETFQFTPSNAFPGIFEIVGNGEGINGPFTFTGEAIVTSKGRVTAFKNNQFESGDSTTDILKGPFKVRHQRTILRGKDSNGAVLHTRLNRLP